MTGEASSGGNEREQEEVRERLREEWEVLGQISYTGWQADLSASDIEHIRSLLRDAGASLARLREERDEAREALAMLRSAWNAHMSTCAGHGPTVSWEQMEDWRNAPSNTASAAASVPEGGDNA